MAMHHRRTISRTDEEWNAMREPFRKCYIDQDMSLKEATKYLAEQHAFPASERQWERKKEQWGFSKYTSRATRQQFIEQALARGMSLEDILNAPDIPLEGTAGDDRTARRNWRRYVKREQTNRSRSRDPHSPVEGQRRSFDGTNAPTQIVEKTYDVGMPDGIVPDQSTGNLPDTLMLEATSTDGSGQSPIQVHVVSEVHQPPDTNPQPEIFFSLSEWDDASGGLHNHGPLPQMQFTNFTNMGFQGNTNIIPPTGIEPASVGGMDEAYNNFSNYQQPQNTTEFGQQTVYNNQDPSNWGGERDMNVAFNAGQQEFYGNSGTPSEDSEVFPPVEEVPDVQFDQPFDPQPSTQAVTPRTGANNDFFQSMTADPLTADLSNMIDQYTSDVQKTVKSFLAELPKLDPKVLQKMIEDSLQSRRDLCLITVSREIENQAKFKQRALDSITEKCRNLERIMAEKGIDTRAELRQLKARSNPRQPTENGSMDMSQFYAATSAIF